MSKERQRARQAREAARQAELKAAAERRVKQARRAELRARLTPSVPTRPTRRRRYGALSHRELGQLAAVFVAVQVVVYVLTDGLEARLGLALLTLAVLAVVGTTRKSTHRRSTTR
jgi:Flp pilus assembly protein TadB